MSVRTLSQIRGSCLARIVASRYKKKRKMVVGSIPGHEAHEVLFGVCMFSLCPRGFSLATESSTAKSLRAGEVVIENGCSGTLSYLFT